MRYMPKRCWEKWPINTTTHNGIDLLMKNGSSTVNMFTSRLKVLHWNWHSFINEKKEKKKIRKPYNKRNTSFI